MKREKESSLSFGNHFQALTFISNINHENKDQLSLNLSREFF